MNPLNLFHRLPLVAKVRLIQRGILSPANDEHPKQTALPQRQTARPQPSKLIPSTLAATTTSFSR